MKYRKRPVVIEAFQYDGNLRGTNGKYCVPKWAAEAYEKGVMHYGASKPGEPLRGLFIDTLEGAHHVSVGDYVIQGVHGELYPCKPDIFEETYEPADGLDQYEHGTKLSAGLQEIVSAYTRIQDTNSLRDEDICLFEVVLREGKKFSNKALRDFLEQEGMTIVSVRDSRHAIVSSSKAEFGSLQRRVGNYRDNKKSNKKFQYIDDFKFPNPLDKLAPSIRDMLGK